jgi:hypothetical protein
MKKVIRLTESDLYRIVKRVLKEEETDEYIPTGEPSSDGYKIILDSNQTFGIVEDSFYLCNLDPVFKNYNTTKKIPNGVDYYLTVNKTLDGFNVDINHDGYLTIKDQKLVGNTWEDLFSKFNNVSFKTPNDLLSDEDDIFQSLLDGTVPCFKIDDIENNIINYNIKTGTVNSFKLKLKSMCDEKINGVELTLDSENGVYAEVTPSSGTVYTANVVWDGNDLSFPKSKSGKSELIIKVNESIRKVLRSYFL